jgi:hypothetical protein
MIYSQMKIINNLTNLMDYCIFWFSLVPFYKFLSQNSRISGLKNETGIHSLIELKSNE